MTNLIIRPSDPESVSAQVNNILPSRNAAGIVFSYNVY